MSALEKFFLGFIWIFLMIGALLISTKSELTLFVVPLTIQSFLIMNWVLKSRMVKRALAKGVIHVAREEDPSSALLVEREPPFPITRDDYANLQGAVGKLANWMSDPLHQSKFPVIFYFRGYYRFLATKHDLENLVTELHAKYRELS